MKRLTKEEFDLVIKKLTLVRDVAEHVVNVHLAESGEEDSILTPELNLLNVIINKLSEAHDE